MPAVAHPRTDPPAPRKPLPAELGWGLTGSAWAWVCALAAARVAHMCVASEDNLEALEDFELGAARLQQGALALLFASAGESAAVRTAYCGAAKEGSAGWYIREVLAKHSRAFAPLVAAGLLVGITDLDAAALLAAKAPLQSVLGRALHVWGSSVGVVCHLWTMHLVNGFHLSHEQSRGFAAPVLQLVLLPCAGAVLFSTLSAMLLPPFLAAAPPQPSAAPWLGAEIDAAYLGGCFACCAAPYVLLWAARCVWAQGSNPLLRQWVALAGLAACSLATPVSPGLAEWVRLNHFFQAGVLARGITGCQARHRSWHRGAFLLALGLVVCASDAGAVLAHPWVCLLVARCISRGLFADHFGGTFPTKQPEPSPRASPRWTTAASPAEQTLWDSAIFTTVLAGQISALHLLWFGPAAIPRALDSGTGVPLALTGCSLAVATLTIISCVASYLSEVSAFCAKRPPSPEH